MRATAKILIALFALSCVTRAHPWRPHKSNHHLPANSSNASLRGFYQLDQDLIEDRVTLESNGCEKRINIRFGNFRNQHLGFKTDSNEDGKLIAGDIDRDGDVDLIWIGSAATRDAVVLLNEGDGSFVEATDSDAYSGELDGLFGGDSRDKRLVKHHRKNASLVSSTFSEIAPTVTAGFLFVRPGISTRAPLTRLKNRLVFLVSLPPRGPPRILF
jgi:hypothetical protein